MSADLETLKKARAALEHALMGVVRDLADVDPDTSVITIGEMANRIATLQAGIEAIDRALTTTDRYQPTYFEGT